MMECHLDYYDFELLVQKYIQSKWISTLIWTMTFFTILLIEIVIKVVL